MKVQFAIVLKDRHGADIVDAVAGPKPGIKSVTLGDICCGVLDSVFTDEQHEGLKPKLRRNELVELITAAEKAIEPLDLLDADIEMIKERIGKRNFPPSITAAAVRLLVGVGDTKAADRTEGSKSSRAPSRAAKPA